MPPRPISRRIRKSPSSPSSAPATSAGATTTASREAAERPRSASTWSADNTRRICSACWGGARIMVTGGSYGGHMTLVTATRYNDKIRCSVDVVGISNLVTFLEHTEGYRRDLRRVEYGDERDPAM